MLRKVKEGREAPRNDDQEKEKGKKLASLGSFFVLPFPSLSSLFST